MRCGIGTFTSEKDLSTSSTSASQAFLIEHYVTETGRPTGSGVTFILGVAHNTE